MKRSKGKKSFSKFNTSNKKHIMVVDDEKHILELMEAILKQENYEVLVAHNGKECLDMLKKVKPDLILLDIMMPGMSGVEVCEKIRSDPKLRLIKIIYLTVINVSTIEKGSLKKTNVVDYIRKPFDNKKLVSRIKEALK